ncbi:hypothetical protein, partial [Methylogaea oryzae]|uniref:hypothetical protein n=1 Tax=Methylogaea oryzae TaxID=1295382 RepID=UPI00138ED198
RSAGEDASAASRFSHEPQPAPAAGANAEVLAVLQQELRRLGKVVDMRLMEAGWQAASRDSNTTRLDLLRGLCDRGFAKAVALNIANRLSTLTDSEEAWRQAKDLLVRQLRWRTINCWSTAASSPWSGRPVWEKRPRSPSWRPNSG